MTRIVLAAPSSRPPMQNFRHETPSLPKSFLYTSQTLGRVMTLGTLIKPLKEREIIFFGYSEWLYLISTDGSKYDG